MRHERAKPRPWEAGRPGRARSAHFYPSQEDCMDTDWLREPEDLTEAQPTEAQSREGTGALCWAVGLSIVALLLWAVFG